MRRSAWISLFVVVTAAAAAAIALLWVPRVEQQRDRSWTAAGERAIAAVRLPERFQARHRIAEGPHGVLVCGPTCFAAPGSPRDNVDGVRQAVAEVATGPVSAWCGADGGFASTPDKCRITAPVGGSRLEIWLVARLSRRMKLPVDAGDFDGTLVQLLVAPRQ